MDRDNMLKPLVMVVEDEPALSTMLRYNLEKEGYRVCEAMDGEEALTVLAERNPDIVLLDWMLPVLSGIEVCRQIRRKPRSRDLPVIMLTARGEEGDKVRGLNTGADDYLTKPFSLPELLARIKALLRRAPPAPAGKPPVRPTSCPSCGSRLRYSLQSEAGSIGSCPACSWSKFYEA